MKNKHLVSVVIPTYNRAHYLPRAINSVLSQSYSNFELIIVDNNSTDGTEELVNAYTDERIKFIKIHNNGIISASRNKGISSTNGKYIAFLDSDDWWTSDKLKESILALDGGMDLVYHDLYIFRDNRVLRWKKLRTKKLSSPVFDDLILSGKRLNLSSVVLRRSLIEKVGGFSEDVDLIAAEDIDTWLRISRRTNNFYRLDGCYGFYHIHLNNYTSNDKTIISIKKRLDVYKDDLNKLKCEIPIWACYSLARSYSSMNDSRQLSKKYFIKTIVHKKWSTVKIRSLIYLFLLLINKRI
jgi:glycosyltransferase involved in cell wall biosynthesis